MSTKRTSVIATTAIAVVLAIILVAVFLQQQNNMQARDAASERSNSKELKEGKVYDSTPKAPTGAPPNGASEEQMTGPPDERGEQVSYDIEDMPPAAIKKADALGRAWITFDTADDPSVRRAQLAKVISNPDEWVDHQVVTGDPGSNWGLPGYHTTSYVNGEVIVPENMAMKVNGNYEFIVQMKYAADHESGAGTNRGTTFGTMTWGFTVTPDWKLLDVREPTPK